jgi:dCMP deaminase
MRVRASWDEYFMNIAREVSTRSTCDRKFVGAVIVRDKSILATGYNGSIRGLSHCDEEGHLLEDGHCVRTVHAEANAIVQAARHGVRIDGASLYVTASPCWGCFRLIANAGIIRVHFGEFYRDQRIFEFAKQLGIALVDMSGAAGSTATGSLAPSRPDSTAGAVSVGSGPGMERAPRTGVERAVERGMERAVERAGGPSKDDTGSPGSDAGRET